MTPCLAAVYAGLPLMPMTPAPEEVFTIAPPPCFRISGISCFMHKKTPRRSILWIGSHSASSRSDHIHLFLLSDCLTAQGHGNIECRRRVRRTMRMFFQSGLLAALNELANSVKSRGVSKSQ